MEFPLAGQEPFQALSFPRGIVESELLLFSPSPARRFCFVFSLDDYRPSPALCLIIVALVATIPKSNLPRFLVSRTSGTYQLLLKHLVVPSSPRPPVLSLRPRDTAATTIVTPPERRRNPALFPTFGSRRGRGRVRGDVGSRPPPPAAPCLAQVAERRPPGRV